MRIYILNLLLILCCILLQNLLLIFCSSEQLAALQRDVHYGRWAGCEMQSCTALHRAAIAGHTAVCEQLIANKADVNAETMCAFIF